jgi:hypothetical protein
VDVFLTRIGPSGQARLALVSRGSNFDVAMAATIYWSARPAEAQGKPGDSSAVLEPQRSAYSRSFWDGPVSSNQSASEKVLSASDHTCISDLGVGVVVWTVRSDLVGACLIDFSCAGVAQTPAISVESENGAPKRAALPAWSSARAAVDLQPTAALTRVAATNEGAGC